MSGDETRIGLQGQDRKTFRVVVEDSYETGGQNWTDRMIEDFKKVYGYDPVPFIPVYNGVTVISPLLQGFCKGFAKS